MSDEWQDVEAELNSGGGPQSYYKPNQLPVGQSETVVVTRYMKWTQTKYPIKTKDGKELGYTWRFRLQDGRIWDVANANRKILLSGLHPGGDKVLVPGRFRITNIGKVVNKQPSVKVEYLGEATTEAGQDESIRV